MSLDLKALEGEVLQALKDAGAAMREDLWKPDDAQALAYSAEDLVRLGQEAITVTDPEQLAEVKRRAKYVLQHVELLALRRAREIESELEDRVKALFMDRVLPALLSLLPALL